jgi:hypothetical protein
VTAVAPAQGGSGLVLRRAGPDAKRSIAASRLAASVAAELATARSPGELAGVALDHATRTVDAAVATLDLLADEGWRSILGDPPDSADRVRIGADSVAERTESFDPLEVALAALS